MENEMKRRKGVINAVVEKTDTGYSAYVPDLPGCISVGDDKEQIESNIREAIVFHLQGMKEDGVEIPTEDAL